jgi:integrase/recombinase XerD
LGYGCRAAISARRRPGSVSRALQAILGHVRLDTTSIYTQVSIRKLKEIHTLTHPARADRSA